MSKKYPAPNAETTLSSDIHFKGIIRFNTSLRINGTMEGEIQAKEGELIIGESSQVKANIDSKNIYNLGKIEGNISAENMVAIYEEAELVGDVKTKSFIVEHGGFFSGNCIMIKNNEEVK